jgi:hypothetical protein
MKSLLLTALLLCSIAATADTPRANLTGTVVDTAGNPLPGVTVMVYHAGVKVGYSTFCPSCYQDCGKRVVTDAKGAFEIKDLAGDLWFTLLAARDGYVSQITKSIDPEKNPSVSLKLAAKPPATNFSGTVRGRVVEADGSPVRDAIVTPLGLDVDGSSIYGSPDGLEPIATTNQQGEFDLSFNKPSPRMLLSVEARALAPKVLVLETGPERRTVTLSDGATVAGRLMASGKPVPNAQVGLAPMHQLLEGDHLKISGDPYDEIRVGTDADGRFTVTNVPAPVDWYLYAKMESVSSLGATSPIEVKVAKDGQALQVRDLVLKRGYRVRGTVVAGDGKPIAQGMHVSISSTIVADSQTVPLASDGHFEFANLPPGKYTMWTSVKGYDEDSQDITIIDRDLDGFASTINPTAP